MQIHTFRANSMPRALDLVRQDLGPEAMVLHTRELKRGLLGRWLRGRAYEIAASISPPSKGWEQPSTVAGGDRAQGGSPRAAARGGIHDAPIPAAVAPSAVPDLHQAPSIAQLDPSSSLENFTSLVQQLRSRRGEVPAPDALDLTPALFDVHADLLEADADEATARDLLDRLRCAPGLDPHDAPAVRRRLAELVEAELTVTGPLRAVTGAGRLVALVGPTGVGKTTTIAKLAANYRLKEDRRVGLITVDTYRIAAVEQLRTYAQIIDLPMEVVSTPREMRAAVARMRDFDLVLMDTAGRSPRDEVRIRELRTMLAEAEPDEVHLVLSAASSARSLAAAAEKFGPAGVTALMVTKLDEATGLGSLLTLARTARLPFSYLTDGQNVPDDIAVAEPQSLARIILNQN